MLFWLCLFAALTRSAGLLFRRTSRSGAFTSFLSATPPSKRLLCLVGVGRESSACPGTQSSWEGVTPFRLAALCGAATSNVVPSPCAPSQAAQDISKQFSETGWMNRRSTRWQCMKGCSSAVRGAAPWRHLAPPMSSPAFAGLHPVLASCPCLCFQPVVPLHSGWRSSMMAPTRYTTLTRRASPTLSPPAES